MDVSTDRQLSVCFVGCDEDISAEHTNEHFLNSYINNQLNTEIMQILTCASS